MVTKIRILGTNRFLALLAALAAVSCSREAIPDRNDMTGGILCRIETGSPETKTLLKDDPGIRMTSKWQADDAIGIFSAGESNKKYQIVSSSISSDGKAAEFQGQAFSSAGALLAYSPYQEGATRSGESLMVTFPATQQYAVAGNMAGPDPAANILAGSGDGKTGLSFRPVAAILKIGQVFDESVTLTAVEFRDLAGKAVCGTMRITPGTEPSAEITGSGKVITLSLGDGLALEAGQKRPLYLIVPAREYARGFSLTFVTLDGNRIVRTIGAASGKTLKGGTVYPIGDITRYEYLSGESFEMTDGTLLVTAEKADMMKVVQRSTVFLRDIDGNGIPKQDGGYYSGPALYLIAREELNLKVGNYLIFEQGSDLLPAGGILKVKTCSPLGGGYCHVYAESETNVAAPYAQLHLGGRMYDDEGHLIEDKGQELDLSSYVTDILDEDGNSIPFNVQTKGSGTSSLSFPGLSLNLKQDHAEAAFSAALTLNSRIAVGAVNGEFQYVYVTVNPVFHFGADFKLKAEFSKTVSQHLVTLVCAPIPVAPGVLITPTMDIRGYVGIGGDLVFSASLKYKYDMGTFGVAYNKGDGFTARHIPPVPDKEDGIQMELGGLSGSLSASGGFSLYPKFSIYGLMEVGVQADCGLKFGIDASLNLNGWTSPRLFLQPSVEMYPFVASLGGYLTKSFKNLTVSANFDPIWERYFWPRLNINHGFFGPVKQMKEFGYITQDESGDVVKIMSPIFDATPGTVVWAGATDAVFTKVDGMKYRVQSSLPSLSTWDLYVEYLTGGTMATPTYSPWEPIWCASGTAGRGAVPSTGMSVAATHKLLHIPAGEKDLDVTSIINGGIPVNEPFSYRFVLVNADTGAVCDLDMKELKGNSIDVPATYIVSWPTTPDGKGYFVNTKTVRLKDFDGSVPVKTPDNEPDGYIDPPDFN